MPRFWRLALLIAVLSSLAQLLLPWWVVVPVAFAVAAGWGATGGRAFLAGLLGVGLSWWLPALWLHTHGAARLADRLATLLPLGGSGWTLALVSGLVAGVVGGLAALSGAWVRQAARPRSPEGTSTL
ncbi:hypothetical protein K3G63_19550 [Hymenobacter sp. HSC-4F20]|uniref:hypothetical protein n=1 Tax=Hymenobacter sp. HSC-4F20 TaxID=2864135 RepID=UPI001C733D70|nr:hypothetical protein [Hymenobacter sp. HSC-4F20]MBX0292649.1 hypothetical protein [Hymenobacter sp. HSC-4F20]